MATTPEQALAAAVEAQAIWRTVRGLPEAADETSTPLDDVVANAVANGADNEIQSRFNVFVRFLEGLNAE